MRKKGAKLFYLLISLSMTLQFTPIALTQTQTTGEFRGRVYDIATNQGIPGAKVIAKHKDTGVEFPAATDENGDYSIKLLPSGPYEISASANNYENASDPRYSFIKEASITITQVTPVGVPPIALQKIGSQTTPSGLREGAVEQLVNTVNATRGGSFGRRELLILPLPGVRTFDDLAFLLPGVAPPPLAIGRTVGPGIGPGVGTSGQFSVNGLRSRSNNFTIDGSDNNDEEIGVRRQGFTALVPQSIESVQEYHVTTLLPEPQYGRNMGAQVDAVSRSGGTGYHGTIYGFFNNQRLNARDPFNHDQGGAVFVLTPVCQGGCKPDPRDAIKNPNGTGFFQIPTRKNPYTRGQYGLVFGGPIVNQTTHFIFSVEHQDINASKLFHFAVPTFAERGLFGTGTGGFTFNGRPTFPTNTFGDAFFSFFPFPNNLSGPYRDNTFSEVLPADAEGTIFSFRLDQKLKSNHTLTGRYNFTDDDTILPVTGEALFSSLDALVRTQNLSVILNSIISSAIANQARFSYGRTNLDFEEVRDPFLIPSKLLPNEPFILNAPAILNFSLPGSSNRLFNFPDNPQFDDTEGIVGPLGQIRISGYSPVGVDVFNFPQSRTNNTFQYADTLFYTRGGQRFTFGLDIRQTQLNSLLERNFRPLAVFSAAKDLSGISLNSAFANGAPVKNFLLGRDFAAAGAPTGFFQTQALNRDASIRMRYLQNNFFFSDQFRVRQNITLTLGLRYELNTVPTEVDRRIESTFDSPEVADFIQRERDFMRRNFGRDVSGLEQLLGGRNKIYERDNNNIAPHIAIAWGNSRTSIRAGYGIYYDQIPGAVISQSRSVFPSFINLNFAGGANNSTGTPQVIQPQNPFFIARPGTLNTFNNPNIVSFIVNKTTGSDFAAGPSFVLPAADLVTPYAQHWGLTIEREIMGDFLLSAAYVGTKGVHLLRFATPNLGPNSIPRVDSITVPADCTNPQVSNDFSCVPFIVGRTVPPSTDNGATFGRPFPLLGSVTTIESDSDSTYHSLQLQLNKRFSSGIQFTTAYTWSHALDEVSELFDTAGARALPLNSFDRRAERASANFDIRHRFVYSTVWDLPIFEGSKFFGGWQLASIGTFQTGQPYTVLFCCDQNLDGNLTDRPGLVVAGTDSGRNAFRARGIVNVDAALNKNFNFSERHKLEFRTEVFNLFNRPQYGIPIHQLFFGGFTDQALNKDSRLFVDTVLPSRTIQFALKYNF